MEIRIGSDGHKGCLATISGFITSESKFEPILYFDKLLNKPPRLRLDAVTFAIQEKMGFNLWWTAKDKSDWQLIMPLESRGYFDFEKAGFIYSPPEAIGVCIEPFNLARTMSFLLILDFTKP